MNKFAMIYIMLVQFLLAHDAQGVQYTITNVGASAGASIAEGINESGQVVGRFKATTGPGTYEHAFLWEDGVLNDLGTLYEDRYLSQASCINESGQIVGYSNYSDSFYGHAFLYENGVMQDLGTLGGDTSSASCINDSGQIVGRSTATSSWDGHAFLYDGSWHDIGGYDSAATAINNSGQVAGHTDVFTPFHHAFLWDGTMHDLGTLRGSAGYSYAQDLNESGLVVGYSEVSSGGMHAFIYDGGMHDLGTLGGSGSVAEAINDKGEVVGYSRFSTEVDEHHAFIYRDDVMSDLNSMIPVDSGWTLEMANDINNKGQVVGAGFYLGDYCAFLLTPVPEPSTFALAVFAMLGLGWYGWWRRKN